MKVVTAGVPYIDIDAYAGCIAYAELLNLQGHRAIAASSARWNESISKTVRSWQAPFVTDYNPSNEDTYVLIDVSDPGHFDTFVAQDRVETVIDHHPHFIDYWANLLGDEGHVEFIGAAATLVYERWVRAGLQSQISSTSARLLVCAILDNTLNFKAGVSTDRDERAHKELLSIASLPSDWTAQYFSECQASILADVPSAIRDDMKRLTFKTLHYENIAVGQMVVWDAREFMAHHQVTIAQTMDAIGSEWLMSIVSISEGRSYFISNDSAVQQWLSVVLGVTFSGDSAVSDRLWLRKEIMKQDGLA